MNIGRFIRIYLWILVVAAFVLAVVWFWHYGTNLPAPATRSNADFTQAIARSQPELFTANGQPIFTVKQAIKPIANWYVVKLTTKVDPAITSYIIISDPHFAAQYMKVVASPESKFSNVELSNKYIPVPVLTALRSQGVL